MQKYETPKTPEWARTIPQPHECFLFLNLTLKQNAFTQVRCVSGLTVLIGVFQISFYEEYNVS